MCILRAGRKGSAALGTIALVLCTALTAGAHLPDPPAAVAEIDTLARTCPGLYPALHESILSAYAKWNSDNHELLTRIRTLPEYSKALEDLEKERARFLRDLKTWRLVEQGCQELASGLGDVDWQALLRPDIEYLDKGSKEDEDE